MIHVIDKRVNSEMNKIKKCVEEQVDSVKTDITAEFRAVLEEVNTIINEVSSKVTGTGMIDNLTLNIVILSLAEHERENVLEKSE